VIRLIKQDQVLQQLEKILPTRIARFVFCIILLNLSKSSLYFQKTVALGVVERSGDTSCTATGFVLDSGVACCQTDLCNGALANNQMPIMLIVSLAAILAQIQ